MALLWAFGLFGRWPFDLWCLTCPLSLALWALALLFGPFDVWPLVLWPFLQRQRTLRLDGVTAAESESAKRTRICIVHFLAAALPEPASTAVVCHRPSFTSV